MTSWRLHTTSDKLTPDVQQILLLGTKQVNTLSTCDLGVQVILLSNLAYDDKFVGSDFTTGYTRHHRVGSITLDVTQETVVCVLKTVGRLVHNVSVPQRSHDAGHCGLAQLTTNSVLVISNLTHDLVHRLKALDHDNVEQVGTVIVKIIGVFLSLLSTKDQLAGRYVKFLLRLDHGQKLNIVANIANHHTAEKIFSILGKDVFLVDVGEGISVCERLNRLGRLGVSIDQVLCVFARKGNGTIAVSETVTKTCDVDSQQLELGAHIRSLEGLGAVEFGLGKVEGNDFGHCNTRADETVCHAPPTSTFSNGVDVWHACPQVVVDNNTASLANLKRRAINFRVIIKDDSSKVFVFVCLQTGHTLAQVDVHTKLLNLICHHLAGRLVDLSAQNPGRSLNKIDFVVAFEIQHSLGGFQTEQTTTHDNAIGALLVTRELDKLVQVIDCTVYKDSIAIPSFQRAREDSF
ncbi:hypothetical protein HG531_005477 [Fusarium graminearum]|nr:hypothetical protein HG531_005477 [Fusarium graminearum]